MQDLRGSQRADGKFDKNNAVFDMDWDLVIYDEAHEGTQTQRGQKVQSLLEAEKNGKAPKVLQLSGTPYNLMQKYENGVIPVSYTHLDVYKRQVVLAPLLVNVVELLGADGVVRLEAEIALGLHEVDDIVAAALDGVDRKSTRLNSSHSDRSRMPSSA